MRHFLGIVCGVILAAITAGMATPPGWTAMADVRLGDILFDETG